MNGLGAVRPLPAVVLALVSGYVDCSSNSALTHDQMAEAIERLTPAEAATHMHHPNLWTWRPFRRSSGRKPVPRLLPREGNGTDGRAGSRRILESGTRLVLRASAAFRAVTPMIRASTQLAFRAAHTLERMIVWTVQMVWCM